MRKWILLLVALCSLHSFGQKKKIIRAWKAEDLINVAMTNGLSKIKAITDPMNLLFMDSTLAKKLIDAEFNSGFCIKRSDVAGIYIFCEPEYTLKIAEKFNDRYAAEKLFSYYCKLPKFIHSDTIYNMYSSLEKMISTLKPYSLKGFREKLKRDYYDWQKLARKAAPKVYPVFKRGKKFNWMEEMKFRKSDLYPDCNLIVYILANALKDLKEPGFNEFLIEKLKKKQTYPYLRVLFFSSPFPFSTYKSYLENNVTTRQVPYYNIEQFVRNSKAVENIICPISGDWKSNINGDIIYCNKNKAWVEVSRQDGFDGYVLDLKNHQLKIIKIWWTQE